MGLLRATRGGFRRDDADLAGLHCCLAQSLFLEHNVRSELQGVCERVCVVHST